MQVILKFANQIFSGLRLRLLIMVAVACMPLVILTLHTSWDDRRRAKENWQQQSQKMLELARREEEKLIGETRQFLLAMADGVPVRNGNRRGSKKLVDQLFDSYPRYANLGVISTNGEILASAADVPPGANQVDKDFFRRVLDTASFVIDDFPTNTAATKPLVNFGYPVFDRAGQAQAAVFAALDLSWFNRFGSELPGQLPRGATWVVLDRRGNLVSRYPAPKNWSQELLPERALLKTMLTRSEGVMDGAGPNGVPTFYAY